MQGGEAWVSGRWPCCDGPRTLDEGVHLRTSNVGKLEQLDR